MTKDTGGPAFPQPLVNTGQGSGIVTTDDMQVPGMTLRDYFAAKALQGLLADPTTSTSFEGFASDAYAFADAMIAERNK